jgi:hypothetical protein
MKAFLQIEEAEAKQIIADHIARNMNLIINPDKIDLVELGDVGISQIEIDLNKQQSRT